MTLSQCRISFPAKEGYKEPRWPGTSFYKSPDELLFNCRAFLTFRACSLILLACFAPRVFESICFFFSKSHHRTTVLWAVMSLYYGITFERCAAIKRIRNINKRSVKELRKSDTSFKYSPVIFIDIFRIFCS